METALKIRRDVMNNTQDLQNYMLDLNNWEEEMKRKEMSLNNVKQQQSAIPPPRNKIKRSKPESEKNYSNKPKKISAYDYSAWDKFDVEKACAELDEEDNKKEEEDDDEEEEEEGQGVKEVDKDDENKKNLSLIDEAFYEKELGNQYVKKEQWAEAIKCYTNAINLDSKNAIYYANRSLCFLKMKNLKAAEVDATVAIQLDRNYVKAYQRRAFARLALGQLVEAKADYEEVLRIEPKNALARVEINKIDEKLSKDQQKITKQIQKKTFNPKEIFKSEESKAKPKKVPEKAIPEKKSPSAASVKETEKKARSINTVVNKQELNLKDEKEVVRKDDGDKEIPKSANKQPENLFKPLPEWCKIVHPVKIPPHKRSKKPLRKIEIVEVDKDYEDEDDLPPEPKTESTIVESVKEERTIIKPKEDDSYCIEKLSFAVPQTSIQFQNCWKIIKKNPETAYSYLKNIKGDQLPEIFQNSLESDFFSELITFIASDTVKGDPELINDFLLGLSKVKRFNSMIMFMSGADRACVKKCIAEIEKIKSKEEISQLCRLYEL